MCILTISIGIPEMIVLRFSIQGEDDIEHINGKCHFCKVWSTCRPLCDIGIHLIPSSNVLMSRFK
jgi:hypothetical protein